MSVVLRETTWRDIEAFAELERELFADDAWSASSWWSELAARPRRHYVTLVEAADEGEVLGYAGLDRGGEVDDVMTIAVAPTARRRGFGRLLLDHLVEAAVTDGAEHLLLEVRADNAAALAMYAERGFTTVSVRRRYYGDVDAHVMRLPLPAADTPGAADLASPSQVSAEAESAGRRHLADRPGAAGEAHPTPTTPESEGSR